MDKAVVNHAVQSLFFHDINGIHEDIGEHPEWLQAYLIMYFLGVLGGSDEKFWTGLNFKYYMHFPGTGENLSVRGWTFVYEDDDNCPQISEACPAVGSAFVKNDKTVWLVNESPYASVGEAAFTFVAHNKETLQEFMKDMEIEGEIQSPYALIWED